MESNIGLNDMNLLIDFNSPVSKRPSSTPLIPVPVAKNRLVVSPTNNNPFDVVAMQVSPRSNDPFESVFKNALINENVNIQTPLGSKAQQKILRNENVHSKHKASCINLNISQKIYAMSTAEVIEKETSNSSNETTEVSIEISMKNDPTSPTKLDLPVVTTSPMKSHLQDMATSEIKLDLPGTDGKSHSTGDYSTDEGLKAVIAKRVNNCIQMVLNNSVKSKHSKSEIDLKTSQYETNMKTFQNRRSQSFITQSTTHTNYDKLNRSCSDNIPYNETFILENQQLNTPSNSSIGSSDVRLLSMSSQEDSTTEDSFQSEQHKIFKEANKLAHTFSKLGSFNKSHQSSLYDYDSDDDIFSCKPPWLDTDDSSENEEEKLRNDPALNVRVSLANSVGQTTPDSQALAAFKNRHRRSVGQLQVNTSMEGSGVKRSLSIGSKLVAVPVIPTITPSVPASLPNQEEKTLRLMKKTPMDVKRGPMRAVMPVQSMTKDSLPLEGLLSKRETSPVRRKKPIQFMDSPNKDCSQLGIRPVASSTPNKLISGMPVLVTPSIQIPSKKRRSLGSTLESRKSRPVEADTGARQRSSSANSSIPTPLGTKVTKSSSIKSPVKLKSTSCLPRNTLVNSQIDSQSPMLMKKTAKLIKSSFNPRALIEVKSQSPRNSRLRSAVNTISTLVAGKSKKLTSRDKENRLPV